MAKRSTSGKNSPAMPKDYGVEFVRLVLRRETKQRLDDLAEKQGRVKYRLISAYLEWIAKLPETAHLFVLGEAPRMAYKIALRDLIRAILPDDLTAEEQQVLIDAIKSHGAGKTKPD